MYYGSYLSSYVQVNPIVCEMTEKMILDSIYSGEVKLISTFDLRKLQEKAELYDMIKRIVKE